MPFGLKSREEMRPPLPRGGRRIARAILAKRPGRRVSLPWIPKAILAKRPNYFFNTVKTSEVRTRQLTHGSERARGDCATETHTARDRASAFVRIPKLVRSILSPPGAIRRARLAVFHNFPDSHAEIHMDIETARFTMIEQQIRTWDVLDQKVLDLLTILKREEFVPEAYRSLAFFDMEIPLPGGESMFAPKLEARLLQELEVKPYEVVLEIGAGSGYMAALLAFQSQHVTSVEILPELQTMASENLARAGCMNVTVSAGDGARGWPAIGEVDIIMVSGSLPLLPTSLLEQLKVGGRLCAVVGDDPAMSAQLVTRTTPTSWESVKMFETSAKPLRNAIHPSRFEF